MNFVEKISCARKEYVNTPILVQIYRKGFMFYIIEVSKGPTSFREGHNHEFTSIYKARERAEELVDEFLTGTGNPRVEWEEF